MHNGSLWELNHYTTGTLGYEHLGCYPDKSDDRDLNSVNVVYFLGILGYEHLGCYPDKLDDRDLNSKEITYAELSVASCVDECRKDGLPYAGLQSGQRCYCGASYGQHGLYPPYSKTI